MALAITELESYVQKRVYIESAMPSAMSHLNRGLRLRAYDSLNKYLCSIMPLELHINVARCNKLLCF